MNFTRTQIELDLQCKMELLGRLEAKENYAGTELHKHPFFEIFYVSRGKFEVTFEKEREELTPGDVFVISSDVLHRFSSADGGEMLYVGLSLTQSICDGYPRCFRMDDRALCELMGEVCSLTSRKGADALRVSAKELISPLCAILLSFSPNKRVETEDALSEKIKNHLRLHMSESITVKDIADALYMNPHYLGEYFKKRNGVSVKEYLLELRMQRAFTLLKEGKLSVSQIAETVGFDTVQYFSTKFKLYYGISPTKYIEKLKGE